MVSKQNVRGNGGKAQMKPYEEGLKAFREGDLGNPHKPSTKQGREWEMGFNKAYFKNKEQVLDKESRRRS